jgi:hypothetical protein
VKQEYRVTYRREGGKKQYKTFQRYPNLLRYVRSLISTSRDDLRPLDLIEYTKRTVGPWYTHTFPESSNIPGIEKP